MPVSRSYLSSFATGLASVVCSLVLAGNSSDLQPAIAEIKDAYGHIIAIEAGPLSADILARLRQNAGETEEFERVLSVTMDRAAAHDTAAHIETAMAGRYSLQGSTLRFTPRFAFRAGQAYRAVLRPAELRRTAAITSSAVSHRFQESPEPPSPPAEVTAIFPSAAVIPENQLRFYIHFSAPMARGSAYEHVRLLDSHEQPVDLPFLELGEELWDPQQQRLTLLIDPGRIKRGVKPRKDLGPVLRAGERFKLIVASTWPDAHGRPLRQEFVKHFGAGPPIEEPIDPAKWQVRVPAAGSREPLAIDFPRPLDDALLERLLTVHTAAGRLIPGAVLVSQEERRWELRPAQAWAPGRFEITVGSALEDLAGNRFGRAFEVDIAEPNANQVRDDPVRLAFEIRRAQ